MGEGEVKRIMKDSNTTYLYIPNEIFGDLINNVDKSTQRAFAYSYYYYINYLYRYCRFIDENGKKMTQPRIKQKLGYTSKSESLNKVMKKGGILDTIGYTETTGDYPVQYHFIDKDMIEFYTINDVKSELPSHNHKNFKIKKPLKAFYRSYEAQKINYLNGTFYEVENTHRIDYNVFEEIVGNKKLKTMGFYIYAYIKNKYGIYSDGFQCSSRKMADILGVSDKTIRKYVDELEKQGILKIQRMIFDQQLPEEEREANIYYVIR